GGHLGVGGVHNRGRLAADLDGEGQRSVLGRGGDDEGDEPEKGEEILHGGRVLQRPRMTFSPKKGVSSMSSPMPVLRRMTSATLRRSSSSRRSASPGSFWYQNRSPSRSRVNWSDRMALRVG